MTAPRAKQLGVTDDGMIECVHCGETKPRDDFVNDRTRSTGKFPWCKPCVLASRQARKAKERAAVREPAAPGQRACDGCGASIEGMHANRVYCSMSCKDRARRVRTFGLETDEYLELIAAMNGRCPICQKKVTKWQLDHNHTTGETTGVTCTVCNVQLLAYSYHNPEIARRLVEYLTEPPVRRMFGERRYTGPESVSQVDRMWGWRKKGQREAA